MRFIAQEVRELMAQLGFRTVNEMVGHTERLEMQQGGRSLQGAGPGFLADLLSAAGAADVGRYCQIAAGPRPGQGAGQHDAAAAVPAGPRARRAGRGDAADPQRQPRGRHHRSAARSRGATAPDGLPDDTIQLHFKGSAGQSFGAFVPRGHDADPGRRRQRLRRQGPVGRQDHRLSAGGLDVRARGEHHHRQRGLLRRDRRRGLHPRHGRRALLRPQQRRQRRRARRWAITAAST